MKPDFMKPVVRISAFAACHSVDGTAGLGPSLKTVN